MNGPASNNSPASERVVWLTGGGPASGKSWTIGVTLPAHCAAETLSVQHADSESDEDDDRTWLDLVSMRVDDSASRSIRIDRSKLLPLVRCRLTGPLGVELPTPKGTRLKRRERTTEVTTDGYATPEPDTTGRA